MKQLYYYPADGEYFTIRSAIVHANSIDEAASLLSEYFEKQLRYSMKNGKFIVPEEEIAKRKEEKKQYFLKKKPMVIDNDESVCELDEYDI